MKHMRVFSVLAVGLLAYFGWSAFHPQKTAASNDPSGTFLITIQDANGNFASDSIITLHADHSVAVIDSRQDSGVNSASFSSQRGVWEQDPHGAIKARTIDWDFPFLPNGSARLDYTFDAGLPANEVKGSVVLYFFGPDQNPLTGDQNPVGTFTFTGSRVTVP